MFYKVLVCFIFLFCILQPTATSETTHVESIEGIKKHSILSLNVYMPPSPFQHTDLGPKLCALCTIGDEGAVRRLLGDSDTDVNETDSTGDTPLHKACQAGELQIIELLLQQHGIDISRRNNNGQTPLHIASKVGNVQAAQLVLDAESDERNAIRYVNSPDK